MGSAWSRAPKKTVVEESDEEEDVDTVRTAAVVEVVPLTGIHKLASEVDITKYDYPFENMCLEGGGNKGMAYVGALKLLEELGISVADGVIKRLAGTSSGAMTAALLAIGYTAKDIEGFLSIDIEDIFLDNRFGFLSLIPNMLSTYGWNPGKKIYEWFGEKVEALLGNPDVTFRQLYDEKSIELCVVVTNLNQMGVEYCHPKTTPDMTIRMAVRMSMSMPVMFAPIRYKHYNDEDMYVDGGLLCNFPIHAYDGWWLSMMKEDGYFNRIKGVQNLNYLMQNSVRFGDYNNQTIGLMLYADDEEDVFRSKLQSRVGTKLYLHHLPDTELAKAYIIKAGDERKDIVKHTMLIQAVNTLLSMLNKHDVHEDQHISLEEFNDVLQDPQFEEEAKKSLFGDDYDLDSLFSTLSQGDDKIDFKDLLKYLETKGLDIQSKMMGFKRQGIDSLSSFVSSLQSTLSTNVGRLFMKLGDVRRTVGINTGHVGTRDFDLEEADRKFLVHRGRVSMEAFLKYFVARNKLKPRRDVEFLMMIFDYLITVAKLVARHGEL